MTSAPEFFKTHFAAMPLIAILRGINGCATSSQRGKLAI